MSSKFSFVFVLYALICCLSVSLATPIKDVSSTDLTISQTKTSTNSERFAVSVKRVDDLVGDNGEFLAERIEAVIINFDLKDDQLLVNNVPVQLDVTSLQVIEAQIVPADITAEKFEQYADNFDIGLVTVQILPTVESLKSEEEGVTIRRISIIIHITEIDGISVVQTQDVVEKVIEFKVLEIADGDQDILVPLYADEDLSSQVSNKTNGHHKVKCAFRSFAARVRHWWRCSSRFTRIVIASLVLTAAFGVIFMAIPAAVQALIMFVRRHTSSSPYSAVANDEVPIVEQVIFIADEEKRALMEQEKDLAQ